MTIRRNILIIIILLFYTCSGKKVKQEVESKSESIIESKTEIKLQLELVNDYSESVELFVKEVLSENMRTHFFDLTISENPKHLRIFRFDGLEKIEAYSNKNDTEGIRSSWYEHFILFVATYKTTQKAINAFDQIKADAKKYSMLDNLESLDDETRKRVIGLMVGVKPGGLITQNGKQIFSLVETCRETPMGENWVEYEKKFLSYISGNKSEIEVLNSDCGKMESYIIEIRNTASSE